MVLLPDKPLNTFIQQSEKGKDIMICVLFSKFSEKLLSRALSNMNHERAQRALIVTYADNRDAIEKKYKFIYDEQKSRRTLECSRDILLSFWGDGLKIDYTDEDVSDFEKWKNADIILLLGGDPYSCIKKINENGIRNSTALYNTIYIGVSAGAKVLCDWFVAFGKDGTVELQKGLGVINGFSTLVHYDSKDQTEYEAYLETNIISSVYGICDDGFIVINNNYMIKTENVIKL